MGKLQFPPHDGYTVGAEVRRVKFGRPPRKGRPTPGIESALNWWRTWDYEAAPHVVIVQTRIRWRMKWALFENRHWGPLVMGGLSSGEMYRLLQNKAREARKEVELKVEREKWDVATAMQELYQRRPHEHRRDGDQGEHGTV